MKNMRKINVHLPVLATAFLGSCAVPTTGVVPQGDGLYTIARQGNSFLVSTDSLKSAGLQEAETYSVQQGKRMKFVHSKEIPAGALGRWPESEILFKCE